MDTVVLEGVQYIKASSIAKQFRYTADYIGQLCRAKKVDARLVGRTWFVNPHSLQNHQRTKYQGEKTTVDTQVANAVVRPVIAREIKSPQRAFTPTQLPNSNPTSRFSVNKNTVIEQPAKRLFVYYESDEESLLPNLHKKREIVPKIIRVEHVGAKRLTISGKRNEETTLIAGDLPDVALAGVLQITEYGSESSKEVEESKISKESAGKKMLVNNDISNKRDITSGVRLNIVETGSVETASVPVIKKERNLTVSQDIVVSSDVIKLPATSTSAGTNNISKGKSTYTTFSPKIVQSAPARKISAVVLASPLIATFFACVCVAVILLVSVTVTVSEAHHESQYVIQVANLFQFLKL